MLVVQIRRFIGSKTKQNHSISTYENYCTFFVLSMTSLRIPCVIYIQHLNNTIPPDLQGLGIDNVVLMFIHANVY